MRAIALGLVLCVSAACAPLRPSPPVGDARSLPPETSGRAATPFPLYQARVVRTFGGEGKTAVATLPQVTSVQVGVEGRIYVLSTAARVVKVFDTTGTFLFKFGETGDGPDRLNTPVSIALTDSTATVIDRRIRWGTLVREAGGSANVRGTPMIDGRTAPQPKAVIFTLDGHIIRSRDIPARPGDVGIAYMRDGARVTTRGVGSTDHSHPTYSALLVYHPGAAEPDVIERIYDNSASIEMNGEPGWMTTVLGNSGVWTVSGDSMVVFADGYAGELRWYSISRTGAKRFRRQSFGQKGRAPTDTELQRAIAPAARFRGMRTDNVYVPAAQVPSVSAIVIANDGSVWVGKPDHPWMLGPPPKSIVWTVIPRRGRPYCVELPPLHVVAALSRDRVLALTNAYGNTLLAEYKVLPQ